MDKGRMHIGFGLIPLFLLLMVDLVSICASQVEIMFLSVVVLNQSKQQAPLPPKPQMREAHWSDCEG
jgi:hypothetical protein